MRDIGADGKWSLYHRRKYRFGMTNQKTEGKRIVLELKNDISEGKYPTHQPLPTIKQLSARYNASYPSIKKALELLCIEKVIRRNGVRYHFFPSRIKSGLKVAIVASGPGRNSIRIETERERNFYRLLSTAAMNHNVALERYAVMILWEFSFYTPMIPDRTFLKSKDFSVLSSLIHMKD
jgi:hypothetical protein